LTISFFLASIIDEINPREIMALAIGVPSEYIELLKRTYFDCMAELEMIRAIVIKLINSKI
jgi:hypothetical protein